MRIASCIAVVSGSLLGCGFASAQSVGEVLYLRLTAPSQMVRERCLPPCACPSGEETAELRGGLILVHEVSEPLGYEMYRMVNASWTAGFANGSSRVDGQGIYEVFGDFVLQERLQMELNLDGIDELGFDSGMIFGGEPLEATSEEIVCRRYRATVEWEPRCPADWNGDAAVESQDFFDFLEAFFGGDANFNGHDGTDSQDYFDFLEALLGGC